MITSDKAAIMLGGHFPFRAPTMSRFLATSSGKLIVLAVRPVDPTAKRQSSLLRLKLLLSDMRNAPDVAILS